MLAEGIEREIPMDQDGEASPLLAEVDGITGYVGATRAARNGERGLEVTRLPSCAWRCFPGPRPAESTTGTLRCILRRLARSAHGLAETIFDDRMRGSALLGGRGAAGHAIWARHAPQDRALQRGFGIPTRLQSSERNRVLGESIQLRVHRTRWIDQVGRRDAGGCAKTLGSP